MVNAGRSESVQIACVERLDARDGRLHELERARLPVAYQGRLRRRVEPGEVVLHGARLSASAVPRRPRG